MRHSVMGMTLFANIYGTARDYVLVSHVHYQFREAMPLGRNLFCSVVSFSVTWRRSVDIGRLVARTMGLSRWRTGIRERSWYVGH